jgi:hypothetical protein
MAARKRAPHKTASAKKSGQTSRFRALANGLYELRLGARVVLDVLVTLDGELMTFIRVDGALLGELPVLGEA